MGLHFFRSWRTRENVKIAVSAPRANCWAVRLFSALMPAEPLCNSLVRVATEAADFEIKKSGVERVTERGRRLCRTTIAEHALVPRFAGKFVGFLAGSGGAFSRSPDRTAVNRLA
jgi:hypothetical protein